MNYNIKKSFKASDLQVGDLMYDALNDVMVKVAFIGETIHQKVQKLKVTGMLDISSSTTTVEIKQFVLEDTEDKVIFMVHVIGKDGKLPALESGKPRFRHLMKNQECSPIINWPNCPCYPSYPSYPYWYYNTPTVIGTPNYNLTDFTTNQMDYSNVEFDASVSNLNNLNNMDNVTLTNISNITKTESELK